MFRCSDQSVSNSLNLNRFFLFSFVSCYSRRKKSFLKVFIFIVAVEANIETEKTYNVDDQRKARNKIIKLKTKKPFVPMVKD